MKSAAEWTKKLPFYIDEHSVEMIQADAMLHCMRIINCGHPNPLEAIGAQVEKMLKTAPPPFKPKG